MSPLNTRRAWIALLISVPATAAAAVYMLPSAVSSLLLVVGIAAFVVSALAAAAFGKVRSAAIVVAAASLGAAVCLAAFLSQSRKAEKLFAEYDGKSGVYSAEILSFPKDNSVTAEVYGVGRAKIYIYGEAASSLRPGDVISAELRLTAPASRVFTDGVYLRAGISGELSLIERRGADARSFFKYIAHGAGERCDELFGSAAPLMRGLIFGDTSQMSESDISDSRAAGINHVFSVSGLHLSVLTGAFYVFGRRRSSALAAAAAVIAFMAITGFSPSVVRAGIMQLILSLSVLSGREPYLPSSLGAALTIMVLINPCAIADVGLQLSFCAVFGIVLICGRGKELTGKIRFRGSPKLTKVFRSAADALMVSLSSQLATAPLCAVYFRRVSFVAPLVNMLALWAITAAFLIGVVSLIFSYIWFAAAAVIAEAAEPLIKIALAVIRAFSGWRYASLGTDYAPVAALAALVCAAVAAAIVLRPGRRAVRGAALVLAAATICCTISAAHAKYSAVRLTLLDLGDGQCVVFSDGENTVAIDCGSETGGAGMRLTDELSARNISKLDALILTSLKPSHASGTEFLTENSRVGEVWALWQLDDEPPCESANRITRDTLLRYGDIEVCVYAPPTTDGLTAAALYCRGACVFVCGDIDADTADYLAATRSLQKADVCVASSHGSEKARSDALLAELAPSVMAVSAAVPAGKENGIPVFGTFGDGALNITFSGGRLTAGR